MVPVHMLLVSMDPPGFVQKAERCIELDAATGYTGFKSVKLP